MRPSGRGANHHRAISGPQTDAAGPACVQGKVIFSRSDDDNGQHRHPNHQTVRAGRHARASRRTFCRQRRASRRTYTAFDLDVHLRPADHHIAVRAQLTVRNDSAAPLAHLPLQISSSLNWEQIRIAGQDSKFQDAKFQVAALNSDVDHTGQLHEAQSRSPSRSPPAQPCSSTSPTPASSQPDAQRLLAIGTPEDIALHSDWDTIDTAFTGLRGFGNVVWYPVSSVPVMLGDGARVFDEMGEHKLRLAGASFRLRLTVEFPHGQPPTVALINGHPAALTVTDSASDEVAGAATAQAGPSTLGFEAPSLFVAIRKPHQGTNLTAWTVPENDASVQLWADAAAVVTPFLQALAGPEPARPAHPARPARSRGRPV